MPEVKWIMLFNASMAGSAWLLAFVGIEQQAMSILATLLLVDYFTGVSKAFVVKQKITSRRSISGILSKLSLLIIPIVVGLGSKAVGIEAEILLSACINLLILSEVYSIIGNIYAMRTGDELPEMDAVAMIGKKIRDFMGRILDRS